MTTTTGQNTNVARMRAADQRFVEAWQQIAKTRNVRAEMQAFIARYHFATVLYLSRELFHAYHAQLDESFRGQKEPPGGFDTRLGNIVVYCDRTLDENGMRAE